MTLQEATERAEKALDAGDLAELSRTIEARRKALQAGQAPTPEIVDAGERLLRGLLAWQQRAAYESARLGQIRRYVEFSSWGEARPPF